MPAGLKKTLGGHDVAAEVFLKIIAPTGSHSGLGGQVKTRGLALQQRDGIQILEISLEKGEPFVIQKTRHVFPLEGYIVIIGQAIDPRDRAAHGQQSFGQGAADESRASGHDHRSGGPQYLNDPVRQCGNGFPEFNSLHWYPPMPRRYAAVPFEALPSSFLQSPAPYPGVFHPCAAPRHPEHLRPR